MRNKKSGAVLIIVSMLMVSFMVILALTLDIGSAYLYAGQLQKAADSAVYSSGRLLPVNCDDPVAINEIKAAAINYAALNGFTDLSDSDITLGNIYQNCYCDILISVSQTIQMNFSKILGISSIDLSRSAKATLTPISQTTSITPLGITKSRLDTYIANNEVTHITLKYGSDDNVQGFFGALDLDGTAGGASDYRLWLTQGYPGEVTIGDVMLYENGNMVGPTYSGFESRYNGCTHFDALTGGSGCTTANFVITCPRIAKVVVYTIDDSGNAIVCGFAGFLLESQDRDGYITGSFVRSLTSGKGSGTSVGSSSDYGLYALKLSE